MYHHQIFINSSSAVECTRELSVLVCQDDEGKVKVNVFTIQHFQTIKHAQTVKIAIATPFFIVENLYDDNAQSNIFNVPENMDGRYEIWKCSILSFIVRFIAQ